MQDDSARIIRFLIVKALIFIALPALAALVAVLVLL
ncbi:phosphoribosylformylglycinamidine synthase-associated small membrane protein [Roseibium aestuarii]|uniref:Phosphoribosylformylglycinamidine synthase-associated small membrane protein n=1 Tax=Roseibium aestuarii TaxID=2600299 RepID=A0ABW4JZ11_9HYPH|nr:phosphoribosylformylglycinamidine synthase-associated small membrane protein [Roseibium aestuarii]